MLWILLIIPITANASSGDDLTINIGLVILSVAVIIHRYRDYTGNKMNDKIESLLSIKQSITLFFTGAGTMALTSANVISIFGLLLTTVGLVFIFLNWRINVKNMKVNLINMQERKRANDLKERELNEKQGAS